MALIGANGAGKSTLLMTICGRPRAAARPHPLRRRGGHAAADLRHLRRGIAQAPEGRRIFPRMTVLENLQIGATVADRADFAADLGRVFALFPCWSGARAQRGGTLSGGEQQMLAIGRALMSRPRLLLLDEPSLGLAPLIVKQIFEVIREINERQKVTVLLVEQNAFHALRLRIAATSCRPAGSCLTGRELLDNPEVRAAYLKAGDDGGGVARRFRGELPRPDRGAVRRRGARHRPRPGALLAPGLADAAFTCSGSATVSC